MKLVTVQEMQAIEQEADASGLSYAEMMQNAGKALADVIHQRYSADTPKTIIGLVGPGNNGGDALVALTHLHKKGWKTSAYLAKERKGEGLLEQGLQEAGGEIIHGYESGSTRLNKALSENQILIDGLLGTGIRLPLRDDFRRILKTIQKNEKFLTIVAVDCPSGVDCDSGEAAKETLTADLTICMAAVKKGLLKQPALGKCGEIVVVDIGIPKTNRSMKSVKNFVADAEMVRSFLPDRPADAHKGSFGKVFIAGGSINYCGAVILAARGAYRTGAGLVECAIPGAIYDAIAGSLPEAVWLVLPHSTGVLNGDSAELVSENARSANALIVGPGLGDTKDSRVFIENLIRTGRERTTKEPLGFTRGAGLGIGKKIKAKLPPIVFDADGIRQLEKIEQWHKHLKQLSVITPHPGEISALTKLTVDEIQEDRESIARDYAKKWGHIVVLKGAVTIVASPDGNCTFIPIATSALATAGTGDVLAGMIGGLIAQRVQPYEAAVACAYLHGRAGLLAGESAGSTYPVMAGDIVGKIALAIKHITGTK